MVWYYGGVAEGVAEITLRHHDFANAKLGKPT